MSCKVCTNYETELVYLWFIKDKGTYHSWKSYGRDAYLKAMQDGEISKRENAQRILSGWLKKEIEGGNPLKDRSPYSDLLDAALFDVNWYEIAGTFLPEE
ncbi:MAG: hypothetical protein JW829_14810 [Pirellulales bacterium]|nr:hypothetical protein [Pirellulales bacterium]